MLMNLMVKNDAQLDIVRSISYNNNVTMEM